MTASRTSFRSRCVALAPFALAALVACARGSTGGGTFSMLATDASGAPSSVDAASAATTTTTVVSPAPSASIPVLAGETGDDSEEPDADASDDGDDASGDDASDAPSAPGIAAAAPSPGDLAITEIMLSPSGEEPETEWFEVYNTTSAPKRLSGLVIEDGFFDTAVLGDSPEVVAPPLTYVVLARDRQAAIGALVPASSIVYAYGAGVPDDEGIELDAGEYGDLSLWSGSTMLCDVPYGDWEATFPGQSLELADPGAAEDDPSDFCIAETPWTAGSDEGTPGAASDCGF